LSVKINKLYNSRRLVSPDGNGKQNPAINLVLLSCKSDQRKLLAGFTKLFIAGFFCNGQPE